MEPLFVVDIIKGSPGKNDCLLFYSKLFNTLRAGVRYIRTSISA